MKTIANIFFNRNEHRLRSLWRILLHMILFIITMGLASVLTVLAASAVMALNGTVLIGPGMETQQIINEINRQMVQQPLLRLLQPVVMIVMIVPLYWLVARVLDRRPVKDYGLHTNPVWWRDFGFGLLLGAVLMALIFAIELALGWVTVKGTFYTFRPEMLFWPALLVNFVHYIWVGINEEMLSRGYQLRNLAEGLNFKRIGPRGALLISYIITSSIFGLLHAGNPNATLISVINLILAGLLLGAGMVMTGSLAIPIGLHITWNFFQGNVFGLPVSGMESGISFLQVEQSGPAAWTGGAFGPEGGLLGVLIMLLGILLTWGYIRFTRGSAGLHTAIAEYRPRTSESLPAQASESVPSIL
jgi:uncharacterized protein